jgi:hypothetical protein
MTQPLHLQGIDQDAVRLALQAESDLGYWVESGRYWEESDKFDREKLRAIDSLWLATACQAA